MHVAVLSRRTQILLDEERYERLRSRAAAEGTSIGSLIRAAIDDALAGDAAPRRAVAEFLAAPPLPVAEPDELEREIEAGYDRDAPSPE